MDKYEIKMDLYGDYCDHIINILKARGISQVKDNSDALYQYLNLQKKTIWATKRKVHYANTFQCQQEHRKALNILIAKLECGNDVSLHLSRKAEDGEAFDALLYDWGIYHLHLGTEFDTKKMCFARTDDLLFLKIDEHNAYLIGIYPHGSWSKQNMIEVIHNTWPETIEKFRITGAKQLDYGNGKTTITDQEYASLRKANISTFIQTSDGTVYAPIGWGYTTSGHSTEIQLCCMNVHNLLEKIDMQIRDNMDEIAKQIHERGKMPKDLDFNFILRYENDGIYVVEKKSATRVHGPIALP